MATSSNDEEAPNGVTQVNDSLYQLYAPESGEPNIDIIFFHGLQASDYRNAYWKSWMSKDGKMLWPQTLLGKKFPNARILSVSYHSAAEKTCSRGQGDLYLIAENFVEDLIISQKGNRPIVLVGHSLGGLLLKNFVVMISHIRDCTPEVSSEVQKIAAINTFLANLCGIFYYSTPHSGTKLADIASKIPGRNEVLVFLKILSKESARLNSDFAKWRKKTCVPAFSLVEGLPTDLEIWGVKGMKPTVIVTVALCKVDTDDFYTVLDEDHITICHPNNKSQGGFSMLEQFVTKCLVKKRFAVSEGKSIHEDLSLDEMNEHMKEQLPNFSLSKDVKPLKKLDIMKLNEKLDEWRKMMDERRKMMDEWRKMMDEWRKMMDERRKKMDERRKKMKLAVDELEVISDQGLTDEALGRVAETVPHLSRTFVVEDFMKEVIEGGGNGCFMSSRWLLSLSEPERDTLMFCLRTAGYSETCQTTTTVLFARTENDAPKKSTTDFACPDDIDEGSDDLLGIEREHLDTENYGLFEPTRNNPLETSSSSQQGRNLVNIFPAKRQAATLESFRATVKSKIHQSFCISMMWLSNLEDHEKETLLTFIREVGYEKSSETDNATWYERIEDCKGMQAGGACDTDIPSSSTRNDVASGQVKQSTDSKRLGFSSRKRMVDGDDDASDSYHLATAVKGNKVKDDKSICHEQILRVKCSSSMSRTPRELPCPDGDFLRQQFGDSVGKWPVSKSEAISTSIEKSFRIPTLYFRTDEGGTEVPTEVLMNLKASATISLSCCLRIYCNSQKTPEIRIKFSRISAEIKSCEAEEENEESHGESQEEYCNAVTLNYLCTNVYSGCQSKQIVLSCPPGIRVSANDQHLWLENSAITPIYSDPGSTSLILRGDVSKRRRRDSGTPYPLHFQETHPVIMKGIMKFSLLQESTLNFRIRHQLEVSYYRPSRPILNQGSAWNANRATKVINFDCFFDISIDNISVG